MVSLIEPESYRRALEPPTVVDGRLRFRIDDQPDPNRGCLAAAETVSAEVCERCGGKGDPMADQDARCVGCRCAKCRGPDVVRLPRDWPPATTVVEDDAAVPDRDSMRIETRYAKEMSLLMGAHDDEGEALSPFGNVPGWAGLLRALFLTLRSEQDERPHDPAHEPWRFSWMKEKYGMLDIRSTSGTDYQEGVVGFISLISAWTCIDCGLPAVMRYREWIRPECADCWAQATPAERATHDAHMQRLSAKDDSLRPGHRGDDSHHAFRAPHQVLKTRGAMRSLCEASPPPCPQQSLHGRQHLEPRRRAA